MQTEKSRMGEEMLKNAERNEEQTSETKWELHKVFISLRAWSSSSLIALYFSFWVYNSSGVGNGGGKSRGRGFRVKCRSGQRKRREMKETSLNINSSTTLQKRPVKKERTDWNRNRMYLQGRLWSFPASTLFFLQILHGFPPIVQHKKKKNKPTTNINHPYPNNKSMWTTLQFDFTSLSLSFRILISSSYLSSFSEYCTEKELLHQCTAMVVHLKAFDFNRLFFLP